MLVTYKSSRHSDSRGFFSEIYSKKDLLDYGIDGDFIQDNQSFSSEIGTLRGLHYQAPPFAQGKLVRCARGAILDVAVDIRRKSPTFGNWESFMLSQENGLQLYVPIGFAHGFVTLRSETEIIYKCTDYYNPKAEGSILWSDPILKIDWQLDGDPILSEKDRNAPFFKDLQTPFVYGVNS